MRQQFPGGIPPRLGPAAASIALSAAAARARQYGCVQCIALVDSEGRLLGHALPGNRAAPPPTLLDRAWRAAALSMRIDGFGSEHGPELANCRQCAGPRAPSGLPIRRDGAVIGAIGVTSQSDAPNYDVAEAGQSALRILFAGATA